MTSYIVPVTSSRRHSAKVGLRNNTTVGISIVAIVTDLWPHLTYNSRKHGILIILGEHGIQEDATRWYSEMLPEIHTMVNVIFSNLQFILK